MAAVDPAIYKSLFDGSHIGEILLSPSDDPIILAANEAFRTAVTSALDGLLSNDPMAAVRHSLQQGEAARLKPPAQSALSVSAVNSRQGEAR